MSKIRIGWRNKHGQQFIYNNIETDTLTDFFNETVESVVGIHGHFTGPDALVRYREKEVADRLEFTGIAPMLQQWPKVFNKALKAWIKEGMPRPN